MKSTECVLLSSRGEMGDSTMFIYAESKSE